MLLLRHQRVLLSRRTARCLSSVSTSKADDFDIVIIGGGPVGLSLACALTSSRPIREKLRVTLVDATDLSKVRQWSQEPGTFSNRVSSLTSASTSFLKKIGVWSHVDSERTAPMESMQVWDGISDARIGFSASDLGAPATSGAMAWLTENLNLQRGMLRFLDEHPFVQLKDKTKVQTILRDSQDNGGWPLVELESGTTLRARLLIGADGFNSPVRAYAGIASFGWSYDTQAIVATMFHAPRTDFEGPNTTAYQRFLPTGPVAFLPLSSTASSLVWSTRPKIAQALLASGPAVLASMINAAFRLPDISLRYLNNRIVEAQTAGCPILHSEIQEEISWRERSHNISPESAYSSAYPKDYVGVPPSDSEMVPPIIKSIQPGTMASFPLRFNHTESYLGEGHGSRTVLVGDAAHTVHPLAGQGLNLGLGDVECLSKCIEKGLLIGDDIGSYTALLPYAQERYLINHTMMSAMDKLHKLYTSTLAPVVWARTTGLEVLNELETLKAALMMAAGAQRDSHDQRSSGWPLVAKGVETLISGAKTAKTVGSTVADSLRTNFAARPTRK